MTGEGLTQEQVLRGVWLACLLVDFVILVRVRAPNTATRLALALPLPALAAGLTLVYEYDRFTTAPGAEWLGALGLVALLICALGPPVVWIDRLIGRNLATFLAGRGAPIAYGLAGAAGLLAALVALGTIKVIALNSEKLGSIEVGIATGVATGILAVAALARKRELPAASSPDVERPTPQQKSRSQSAS